MSTATISYLDERGILSSSCKQKIPSEELVRGYQIAELTRILDERMVTLQRQGTISFAMSSRGEEVCVVASAAALEKEDWIYPQYREQGCMFWRGYSIQDYIHHMFCNGKDPILGRQMPNHFGLKALNVVTVSSPVGTQIPQAAGCAYALKLQGKKSVALAYFGEGTASEGDFHTGLNIAAVRKAPVIFFCRNNGYAISTPTSRQFAGDGIAPRGIGYGMTTFRVDGNDFFAVYETVAEARRLCLKGAGPVLIEAMAYRIGAHSTSDDPSVYRNDKESCDWEKKCGTARLRGYLEQKGLWDGKKQQSWEAEVKKEIDQAIEVAKATANPPLDTLVRDVYFEVPKELQEQLQDVKKILEGEL